MVATLIEAAECLTWFFEKKTVYFKWCREEGEREIENVQRFPCERPERKRRAGTKLYGTILNAQSAAPKGETQGRVE